MGEVCVIGAGISGLVTAKTFLARGHAVTVLEKGRHLGGVWDPDRTYPGLTTQTSRDEYAFSDHPMPRHHARFTTAPQMFDYLSSYARRFGVAERIRYGTTVTAVEPGDGPARWTVTSQGPDGPATATYDFVALANGVFNRPNRPDVPGMDEFRAAGGRVVHSVEVTDPAIFDGRRVVVVGFQKSAADIACVAAQRAGSVTLVYRRAMWKMPTRFAGIVPVNQVVLSRLAEALFEPPVPTARERRRYAAARPALRAYWRGVEALLRAQFRLKASGLVPEHRVESQISCALSMAQNGFYRLVRTGRIAARQGTLAALSPGEATLSDGTRAPADIVVLGTGWTISLPFLSDAVQRHFIDEDGYFRLYRRLISPDLTGIALVGYNSSLACQLSAEVGARWLAEWFEGNLATPPPDEMKAEVARELAWMKEHRPIQTEAFRNTCVSPFDYRYLDRLLSDMGAPTAVDGSRARWLLKKLSPPDYAELLAGIPGRQAEAAR